MPQRIGQVRMAARPPLARFPRERLIAQVPDRDLRPHGGAPARVEMNQRVRHGVARPSRVQRHQTVSNMRCAKPLALQRQERDLLRRIEATQVRVKFEAIDHACCRAPRADRGTRAATE